MKKLSGLFVATLMLGSSTLFAQLPEQDSMVNANNKAQRNSSWTSKKNTNKDSTWGSNSGKNSRDTTPSGQSMKKDSMWRSNNSYNKRDITQSNSPSMQRDTAWQSNKSNNRRDTTPTTGQLMQNDTSGRSSTSSNQRDSMQSGHSMHHDTKGGIQNNQMHAYAAEGDTSTAQNSMNNKMKFMMTPDVSSWPAAAKLAVDETTAKYGKPDGVTADELFWLNKGVWEKICISKMETRHSFPIEHTDMMQSTIRYDVPEDKMDDLGKFDGSVTFDRTQGTMSARCDKEANNILALNLAHDVITGKKTVASARKSFADIVAFQAKGGNPLYMSKLTFTPKSKTGDPDMILTGGTKPTINKSKTQKKNK